MIIRLIIVTSMLISLSSCLTQTMLNPIPFAASGASGAQFSTLVEANEDEAIVYVLRDKRFFQGGTYPNILVNDKNPVALRNGGFIRYSLQPGTHKIGLSKGLWWVLGKHALELNVEAGEEYFVFLDLSNVSMQTTMVGVSAYAYTSGDARLVAIDKLTAIQKLEKLKESK